MILERLFYNTGIAEVSVTKMNRFNTVPGLYPFIEATGISLMPSPLLSLLSRCTLATHTATALFTAWNIYFRS